MPSFTDQHLLFPAAIMGLELETLLVPAPHPVPHSLRSLENLSSVWDISAALFVVGFFRLCDAPEGSYL